MFNNLKPAQRISAILSAVAVGFGVASFFLAMPWFQTRLPQITFTALAGLALLFIALADYWVGSTKGIVEGINAFAARIGRFESEHIRSMEEFALRLRINLLNSATLIRVTNLNDVITDPPPVAGRFPYGRHYEYNVALLKWLHEHPSASVRRVDVVRNVHNLERVLRRLYFYDGFDLSIACLFVRTDGKTADPLAHYPVLNIWMFDEREAYVGGYHESNPSGDRPRVYTKDPNLIQLFVPYWDLLWAKGKKIGSARQLNESNLQELAVDLVGLSEQEYQTLRQTVLVEMRRERALAEKIIKRNFHNIKRARFT